MKNSSFFELTGALHAWIFNRILYTCVLWKIYIWMRSEIIEYKIWVYIWEAFLAKDSF